MKHRLTITLIGVAVLATSGYWAIKNNIGKSKNVITIACQGKKQYKNFVQARTNDAVQARTNDHSTASILVTAEYYPWQPNKTYRIDYKNDVTEFQMSTNDNYVRNVAYGSVKIEELVNILHINQHNIQLMRETRTTYNNNTWTKKEQDEHWNTSLYGYNLTINLITMEINVSDRHSSITMKDNSSVSAENTFQGNCTVIHPNVKI